MLPIVQTALEAKGQGLPPDTEGRWMMRVGLHRETGHIQNLGAEGKTNQGLSMEQIVTKQPVVTQESIVKGQFAESILRLPTSTKKFGHYSVGNRRHII